jgi:starch phosphorylase
MLHEYVEQLYLPASIAEHAINSSFDGARDLAGFKARVREGWSQVRIDHVEAAGVSEAPEVGGGLDLRVFASLGGLDPRDVTVQVVHGRVKGEDDILDPVATPLVLAETYEGGRHRFEGHLVLDRPGAFGYTVRVLPHHPALASPAELGLVALA